MADGRTQVTPRPQAGAQDRSKDPIKKEVIVNQVSTRNKLYVKLLRSLVFAVLAVAATASARPLEYGAELDAGLANTASTRTAAQSVGFSCSVDSAYGPDALWSPVYQYAIATVDWYGARALSLYNDDGSSTSCERGATVRVSGVIALEHVLSAGGRHSIFRVIAGSDDAAVLAYDEVFVRAEPPRDLLALN